MPAVSLVSVARFMVRQRRAAVWQSASRISGSSRCGSTEVYQEPGPRITQSASSIAVSASVQAGACSGSSRTCSRIPCHGALGLAGQGLQRRGAVRGGDADLAFDGQRDAGHRQDLAAGAEQGAGPLQPGHRVAQELPEGDDQEVAHGVLVEGTAAALARGEAVLHDVAPGAAPVGVVAQRRQGHAEVTGRQDAVLLTQPAGGSAVVRDGDDRR